MQPVTVVNACLSMVLIPLLALAQGTNTLMAPCLVRMDPQIVSHVSIRWVTAPLVQPGSELIMVFALLAKATHTVALGYLALQGLITAPPAVQQLDCARNVTVSLDWKVLDHVLNAQTTHTVMEQCHVIMDQTTVMNAIIQQAFACTVTRDMDWTQQGWSAHYALATSTAVMDLHASLDQRTV